MLFNVTLKAELKLTSFNTTHTNLGSRVYLFTDKQTGAQTNRENRVQTSGRLVNCSFWRGTLVLNYFSVGE